MSILRFEVAQFSLIPREDKERVLGLVTGMSEGSALSWGP